MAGSLPLLRYPPGCHRTQAGNGGSMQINGREEETSRTMLNQSAPFRSMFPMFFMVSPP